MNPSGPIISSRSNEIVRRARAVRSGKIREQIFVEGVRLCEEALLAGLALDGLLVTERLRSDERAARLVEAIRERGVRAAVVTEQVMESVSDTRTPPGIILLAGRPPDRLQGEAASWRDSQRARTGSGFSAPLVVIMHRVGNPANAGAIVRTAEAAGSAGVIATEGSTDLFSPKALRGAMGSTFRLPLWTGAPYPEIMAWCARQGIRTICAAVNATRAHTELDWTVPCALIVGSEGTGLTAGEVAEAVETVKIPMRPPVESLNVAVASAIVLYEAARQRDQASVHAPGRKKP